MRVGAGIVSYYYTKICDPGCRGGTNYNFDFADLERKKSRK